jgi:hypothetical protein
MYRMNNFSMLYVNFRMHFCATSLIKVDILLSESLEIYLKNQKNTLPVAIPKNDIKYILGKNSITYKDKA